MGYLHGLPFWIVNVILWGKYYQDFMVKETTSHTAGKWWSQSSHLSIPTPQPSITYKNLLSYQVLASIPYISIPSMTHQNGKLAEVLYIIKEEFSSSHHILEGIYSVK